MQQANAWANDCERKLLGLHCGQMLDRTRHREWAKLNWREFWWELPRGTRGYVPRQGFGAGVPMP